MAEHLGVKEVRRATSKVSTVPQVKYHGISLGPAQILFFYKLG